MTPTFSSRSPRATYAETGRLVRVTLAYDPTSQFSGRYCITRIINDIAVVVDRNTLHVGDYLTEDDAIELLTEPGLEITTVRAKE